MIKNKLAKKKYRPGAVYSRIRGKYIDLGFEFGGFPLDGIWLVQDGRNNMSCLISSKEKVPIFALNYRVHEQELCKRIQDSMKNGGISLMGEARLACDYFAEIVAKQKEDKK